MERERGEGRFFFSVDILDTLSVATVSEGLSSSEDKENGERER